MPLVSVEGLDGAGKSSVIAALSEAFPSAFFTEYPSTTRTVGRLIRDVLSEDTSGHPVGDIDEMTMAFLFLADHTNQHVSEIAPALDRGELVISDRHIDSLYTTQGVTTTSLTVADTLGWWRDLVSSGGWTTEPDLTLFIDVPVDVAAARLSESSDPDRYEGAAILKQKRAAYQRLLEDEERFVRLDGTQSKADVAEQAVTAVNKYLLS